MNGIGTLRHVVLVGAECEESLPLRYLQASLEAAACRVTILVFNGESDLDAVAAELAASGAPLAGFSMVFTARADQFARLARRARELGYTGHIVAGGHFAAFNADALLRDEPAFDSVAIGEGERLMVELAAHLDSPAAVRGLVWRDEGGSVVRNPPAPPLEDLDTLPPPVRMTPPDNYLGMPIANMLSSRGCSHACRFCSIAAWHRLCGGSRCRARSARSVAGEMAALHARGYRLFNFHDDNFLPGDDDANLARVDALAAALAARRVGPIGFALKSRPDAVNDDVFRRLRELGLFRVFLGIEAGTAESLRNLGRRQTVRQNERALDILNGLDRHVCFNLLLFNPDSTLEDVRANVTFMQAHADNPMNFCRTEVYSGTPLETRLRAQGRLEGSYWGYGYRIRDPRAQRAFELMHRLMFDRHHSDENVHHLAMRVDYERQLLADFFDCPGDLRARAKAFVRDVNRSSAGFLVRVLDMAAAAGQPGRATLDAFRDDLTEDTRRRTAEAAALLAAIRSAALRQHRPGNLPLTGLGIAASLVLAAGTTAMGQHMSERVAVPLDQPATPPTRGTETAKPTDASPVATNAVQPGIRPPDGDNSRIQPFIQRLGQIVAAHMEAPQAVDIELWIGPSGDTTFAAVYKAGRAKDAVPGDLSSEARDKAKKLLTQLGAATFAERERATRSLQELGAAVLPLVKEHQARENDPEVTERCDRIIRAIDIVAPVRNYDEMIRKLKANALGLDAEGYNRRYVGTIPESVISLWKRRLNRGGVHVFEMAPAARD